MDCHYAFREKALSAPRKPEKTMGRPQDPPAELSNMGYLVLAIRVVDTAMVALVGWHLGLGPWFYVVLLALYAVCLTGFFQYRFHTTRKTAKRMEVYAGMYIIAFDLTLAVTLGNRFGAGVTWLQ